MIKFLTISMAASVAAKDHYSFEKPEDVHDAHDPTNKQDHHTVHPTVETTEFKRCIFERGNGTDHLCLTHSSELSIGFKFE